MPLRFRKSPRIAPGIHLNISKTGLSTTLGPKGLKLNISRRGLRQTASIPGTGLSYTSNLTPKTRKPPPMEPNVDQLFPEPTPAKLRPNKRKIILIIAAALLSLCVLCVAAILIYDSTPSGQAASTARAQTETAAPSPTTKPTKTTAPTNTPTLKPTSTQPSTETPSTDRNTIIDLPTNTPIPLKSTATLNPNAPCNCLGPDLNCPDFTTRKAAQTCFDYCKPNHGDIFNLDSDGDGRVCEN